MSIAKALYLPKRVAAAEKTEKLFKATENLMMDYLHQSEPCATILTFTVFASWLFGLLPMSPLVWIIAPDGSPKFDVLRILSVLCRHALILADLRREDFRALPMTLQPTCLLLEPDLRPAMQRLLHNSSRPGINIRLGRGVGSLYSPKIVISSAPPDDAVFGGGVLQVALHPVANGFKPLDQISLESIADEFQPRYIGYRLRNFNSIRVPEFNVSRFTAPTREIALTLGAAIIGDKRLQEKVLPPLQAQDERLQTERSSKDEAVSLEAVLSFTHMKAVSEVRSSEVAERMSAIYLGRGIDKLISPESAGWTMKRLGLPIGKINSTGNGLKLIPTTCRLVHELALRYCVSAIRAGFHEGCPYCDELSAKSRSEEILPSPDIVKKHCA